MKCSYVGENDVFEKQYLNGEVEIELIPQGIKFFLKIRNPCRKN